MTDKINLYINSRYRKKDETTSYLKCIIPSGLIKSYGKKECRKSICWTNRTRKAVNQKWNLKESQNVK